MDKNLRNLERAAETDPTQAEKLQAVWARSTGDWVERIKKHAEENYGEDGWDYIVEAYEDSEILELIAGATSYDEALYEVQQVAGMLNERREEYRATEW